MMLFHFVNFFLNIIFTCAFIAAIAAVTVVCGCIILALKTWYDTCFWE